MGSPIQINGHSFTAIGVAPPGFTGTESIFTPEFWVPSMMRKEIAVRMAIGATRARPVKRDLAGGTPPPSWFFCKCGF